MACVTELISFLSVPVVIAILFYFFTRKPSVGDSADYLCCGRPCFGYPASVVDESWTWRNFLPSSSAGYRPCIKPKEPFNTWWRHSHEYISPWHPWKNEPLSKHKRITVLFISASFSLLANTTWHDWFPTAGLNVGGLFGVIGSVTIVKLIIGAWLPAAIRDADTKRLRQGPSSSSPSKDACSLFVKYLSAILLAILFIAVCVGLASLAFTDNCSHLFGNVLWGFVLTEIIYAIPFTFIFLRIVYWGLEKKGSSVSSSASSAQKPFLDAQAPNPVV